MKGYVSADPPPSFKDYLVEVAEGVVTGGRHLFEAARIVDTTRSTTLPLVSVITVVKNGVATLPGTIKSVLSQDYRNIEHIVIDGQSSDGTLDLLRAFNSGISLWISEPDLGISDAFNKGIALSRGEIIGLLNSDDWYESGAISAVVAEMRRTRADIACGRLQYWDAHRRTYLVESNPAKLERGMTIGHPAVFVRRNCYQKHGLFRLDFRLAMDYEWLLRARTAGVRFLVVNRCLANMQGGGVGDRRWRKAQVEVGKARALHVKGADNVFTYNGYVVRRIFIGSVRRLLDAVGLNVLRRAYHRWLSPIVVTSSRDDDAR